MSKFNKFLKWKLKSTLISTILVERPHTKIYFDKKIDGKDSAWGRAYAIRSDGKYLCGYTSIGYNSKFVKKWIAKDKLVII